MDKHLPSTFTEIFVLLFVIGKISVSQSESWFDCSKASCQAFFVHSKCNSPCSCGISSNQSTCNTSPAIIANQTDTPLNTTQGHLSCCLCQSNRKFCCDACQSNSSLLPTPSVQQQPTTNTVKDTAFLLAVFITDCSRYLSNQGKVTQSFNDIITNLTNTVVDDSNITCSSGAQPYCGVDVSGLHNQGTTVGSIECDSMKIHATMKSNPTTLRQQVKKLQIWTQLGNLTVELWDGSEIKVSFLISRYSNTSNVLHQGPLIIATEIPPRTTVPPIVVNIWPLIYSGIGVGSFLFLCIAYQCAKQTYYLRKKKFTNINSNRINSRKKKMDEAMENKETTDIGDQAGFDMTHNRIQMVDNDSLTRRYDWTTPGYLPNMLAPANAENRGLNSPPRLMLDDEDSESERRSIGKSSVVNVDESDDDLREILESDDDEELRPNTRQSYISGGNKSLSIPNHRKFSTASRSSQGKRMGSAKMSSPSNLRKASYSGSTNGKKRKSNGKIDDGKRPSFGNIKTNRITPIDNNPRKPSISSLKPRKTVDSMC